jgi:hypothetical protein
MEKSVMDYATFMLVVGIAFGCGLIAVVAVWLWESYCNLYRPFVDSEDFDHE